MKNHVLGTLYGMAIGDAMGMPPELWSRKRCLEYYGKITDFLDGCPENIISYQYKAGQFTDDTSQALTILDSLIETDFVPNSQSIATHILDWAEKVHAFENNILGPTSKVALKLFQEGKVPRNSRMNPYPTVLQCGLHRSGHYFPQHKKKSYVATLQQYPA